MHRLAQRPSGMKLQSSKVVQPGRSRVAVVVRAETGSLNVRVRPYTLRSGDTLESIAKKRDVTVQEILSINPDAKGKVVEGQTILLPASKLSVRDKEILSGIGSEYRVYPVRSGEVLEDILRKRKITDEEFAALNPGIDAKKVTANQLIKLPKNKFTVRETEMLIGSGIVPAEFFHAAFHAANNPFVIGMGVLMGVCGFVLAWQRMYVEPDEEEEVA